MNAVAAEDGSPVPARTAHAGIERKAACLGVENSETLQEAVLGDVLVGSDMEVGGLDGEEAGRGDESGDAERGEEGKEARRGGEEEMRGLAQLGREVVEEVMEAARAGGLAEEDLAAALAEADDWDFLDNALTASRPPPAGALAGLCAR